MSTETQSARLSPAIHGLLVRLRRGIRRYVWIEGLAALVVLLGVYFWLSLWFDWFFELPAPFRIAMQATAGAAFAYLVFRFILRRAFVPLADRSLALVLERRFDRFHDSLMTAVELAEAPSHAADFNASMLAVAEQSALAGTADLPLARVFNFWPLAWKSILAVLLAVSVTVFGLGASDAFGIWARRCLALSEQRWPHNTRLTVEGLEDNQSVKIARGSDLQLVVKADANPGRDVPQVVQVRYTTAEGARGRDNMRCQGQVEPGPEPCQNYTYTFKGVLARLDFTVLGGDDRRGPFHLEVVESPTFGHMTLRCRYPPYMNREPRELPVTGLAQLPRGTEVVVHAEANKELLRVQVDDLVDENNPKSNVVELGGERRSRLDFDYPLPEALLADKTLLFTLFDADGIRSREPIRLALTAAADEAPRVNAQLKGIGTAITPTARLPIVGEITDDYGIARAWFDYRVNEEPARQEPLRAEPKGQDAVALDETLEASKLQLEPKQKLHLTVQAADYRELAGDGPNVGLSQHYVLDVVTPEQLRSMLEARELILRRRLETIIQDLTETRTILTRISFEDPSADSPAEEASSSKSQTSTAAPPRGELSSGLDGEVKESPAQRAAEQRNLQTVRVAQNCQRSAHETLSVAQAFDGIRDELVNNRVDTQELKSRLKDGISDPLKRIVDPMFVELEKRLARLDKVLSDPQAGTQAQAQAEQQVDAILVAMSQVLDKMLELETYSEVLDLLRGIIQSQERVIDRTKERQKQKLRDLRED